MDTRFLVISFLRDFAISVSCCSVNVGGTIDSESYSGLDPKASLPETFCAWVPSGHTLFKTVMVM